MDGNTVEKAVVNGGSGPRKVSHGRKIKLLIVGAVAVAATVALGVGLGVGLTRHKGDHDDADADQPKEIRCDKPPTNGTSRANTWRPTAGTTWQIVLKHPIDMSDGLTPDVEVYDLDMYDNDVETFAKLHDMGKNVICYFSAGSYEEWRDDAKDFNDDDLGHPLEGWPGERWLKIGNENVHNIMKKRIKMAADKGCDAIDPDNVDGYQNKENGLGLKAQDSIDYLKFLSDEAGKYDMGIGLKNAGDIIDDVIDFIDFSVNEECAANEECDTFAPFIKANKPVFHIEYPDGAPEDPDADFLKQVCAHDGVGKGSEDFSTLFATLDLDGWVRFCSGKEYTTKIIDDGDDKGDDK